MNMEIKITSQGFPIWYYQRQFRFRLEVFSFELVMNFDKGGGWGYLDMVLFNVRLEIRW